MPMSTRVAAVQIIRTLRDRGHQGFLVGGCVRDLLLGREPADYDVSTDATPDEVMRIFPQTFAVGAQFGVVLVSRSALSRSLSLRDMVDRIHMRSKWLRFAAMDFIRTEGIPTP
jgi:hypothetical protein